MNSIQKSNTSVDLSSFLPYAASSKKNGQIESCLKHQGSLLAATCKAFQFLNDKRFQEFDALVGENACQIRAIKIALLALQKFNKADLFAKISAAIKKVDQLSDLKSIASLSKSGKTFEQILIEQDIDVSLDPDEAFVVESFILTQMKEVESSEKVMTSLFRIERSEPKNYMRFGDVTASFSKDLSRNLREKLAEASVKFIQTSTTDLESKEHLEKFHGKFIVQHNSLSCIPLFWTFKTVLHIALKNEIPLIVHAKFITPKKNEGYKIFWEKRLFYKKSESGNWNFDIASIKNSDIRKPAFVLQGIALIKSKKFSKTKWKTAFKSTDIARIILANVASHRQYPDPNLDALFEDEKEYTNYKSIAGLEGYSLENPTTFFIQHVFTEITGNVINTTPKKNQKQVSPS